LLLGEFGLSELGNCPQEPRRPFPSVLPSIGPGHELKHSRRAIPMKSLAGILVQRNTILLHCTNKIS
jgi:hypothetical protein